MITGKDLKRMVSAIPDSAVVTIDGQYMVDIQEIRVDTTPDGPLADLKLTDGYSIINDAAFYRFQHLCSSTPDAETR